MDVFGSVSESPARQPAFRALATSVRALSEALSAALPRSKESTSRRRPGAFGESAEGAWDLSASIRALPGLTAIHGERYGSGAAARASGAESAITRSTSHALDLIPGF